MTYNALLAGQSTRCSHQRMMEEGSLLFVWRAKVFFCIMARYPLTNWYTLIFRFAHQQDTWHVFLLIYNAWLVTDELQLHIGFLFWSQSLVLRPPPFSKHFDWRAYLGILPKQLLYINIRTTNYYPLKLFLFWAMEVIWVATYILSIVDGVYLPILLYPFWTWLVLSLQGF